MLTDANNITIVNLDVNSGACVARNEGVKVAKGRIISFVDSDDLILPNRYRSQLSLHDKVDCVSFCDVMFMNRNGLSKHKNKAYCGEDVVDYLFSGGLMQTSTLMLPRKLALAYPFQIGLRKHQDYDFVIRLFRSNWAQ